MNSLPYLTTIQPHQPAPRHQDRLTRLSHSKRNQPLIHHAPPTTTPNKATSGLDNGLEMSRPASQD